MQTDVRESLSRVPGVYSPQEDPPLTWYIPLCVTGDSGDLELEVAMADIFRRVFELWKTKQHDYGPGNISMAGEVGVAVRANDKLQRLMHLNGDEAHHEPIIDAWLDLCDYGAIGAALHLGYWPQEDSTPEPALVIERDRLVIKHPDGDVSHVDLDEEGYAALRMLTEAASNSNG